MESIASAVLASPCQFAQFKSYLIKARQKYISVVQIIQAKRQLNSSFFILLSLSLINRSTHTRKPDLTFKIMALARFHFVPKSKGGCVSHLVYQLEKYRLLFAPKNNSRSCLEIPF